MASTYKNLVVQQLYDARPSPTLEVYRSLDASSNYSPGHTPCPSVGVPSGTLHKQDDYFSCDTRSDHQRDSYSRPNFQVLHPVAPPCTPAATPSRRAATTDTNKVVATTPSKPAHQKVASQNGLPDIQVTRTPVSAPAVRCSLSSPKGVTDVFSLSNDKQLSAQYWFVEEIGYGNWGSVWKIKKRHDDQKELAAKLIYRIKDDKTTPARVKSIWQEFKIIRNFKKDPHPNVIHFYDFILTPSYALVTMDIHNKLMPTHVAEDKARPYFKCLLSAVDYLHSRGVSHNDIKPANILLSSNDEPVLVDFGFANQWVLTSEHAEHAFQTNLSWGTPEYLSPERATQALHDERLSDIWSLGVTMYEIVVGRTPFEKDESEEFLTKDALEEYYKRTVTGSFLGTYRLSLAFEDLIRQMVEPSIAVRMSSCAKGLKHPFLTPRPMSTAIRPLSVHRAVAKKEDRPPAKPSSDEQIDSSVFKAPLAATNPNTAVVKVSKVPQPVKPPANQRTISPTKSKHFVHSEAVSSKINEHKPKIPISASPARKPRKDIKVYKDPAMAQTSTTNITARGTNSNQAVSSNPIRESTAGIKAGLRPLLLRADSAQGIRAPVKSFIDGNPLMSTPTKKFGQAANAWAASSNASATSPRTVNSNASIRSSVTPKKTPVNKSLSVAQTRDSKELRSPQSIKVQKSASSTAEQNKENVRDSPAQMPIVSKESPKNAKGFFRNKSAFSASVQSQKAKEASPPPFSVNTVPLQSAFDDTGALQVEPIEKEKKFKLSKKRPSMKSQKSSSALSFSSLSSSFKGNRGKSLDGRHHVNRDLEGDYAIVERDGRVSFDGALMRREAQHYVDLYIRAPDSEKQEVIQERIISPEAQREFGKSVQQEATMHRERSFATRSSSVSSVKRLPDMPSAEKRVNMINTTAAKIRKSLAPSFTRNQGEDGDDAHRCGGMESDHSLSRQAERESADYRSDSRQTNVSFEERCDSRQTVSSAGTYMERTDRGHRHMPSVTVSNAHSGASHSDCSKNIRSCWSPETVPSEYTCESETQDDRMYRGDEGDDTVHAAQVPEIRRTSGVFTRAPRAESIYQSFICASPNIDIPVKTSPSSHQSRNLQSKPRSDSFNASTWSHSSRRLMAPTPDALKEYSRLAGFRDSPSPSPYTLFPPPDDSRTFTSPPPRPETSQSRKTISKVKSFFGRLGLGRDR